MTAIMKHESHLMTEKKVGQLVTGGCCQWRGSAWYDSDLVNETFILRRKFSGEIATEQQPPTVTNKPKKNDTADNLLLKDRKIKTK